MRTGGSRRILPFPGAGCPPPRAGSVSQRSGAKIPSRCMRFCLFPIPFYTSLSGIPSFLTEKSWWRERACSFRNNRVSICSRAFPCPDMCVPISARRRRCRIIKRFLLILGVPCPGFRFCGCLSTAGRHPFGKCTFLPLRDFCILVILRSFFCNNTIKILHNFVFQRKRFKFETYSKYNRNNTQVILNRIYGKRMIPSPFDCDR